MAYYGDFDTVYVVGMLIFGFVLFILASISASAELSGTRDPCSS